MEIDTIVCGNCLDGMREMPNERVDLVITDMPYNATDCEWDSFQSLDKLWAELLRISKINCPFVFFAQPPFTFKLGLSGVKIYRHRWIWEKDKGANFISASYMPFKKTEDILVFSRSGFSHNAKNRSVYNPIMTSGHKRELPHGKVCHGPSLKQIRNRPGPHALETPKIKHNGTLRYPHDILRFPVPYSKKRRHPAQKPIDLIEYLVRTYSNPNDLIFDPFIGSGTTAVAALKLDRHFYGYDINQDYVDIANERIAKARLETAQAVMDL